MMFSRTIRNPCDSNKSQKNSIEIMFPIFYVKTYLKSRVVYSFTSNRVVEGTGSLVCSGRFWRILLGFKVYDLWFRVWKVLDGSGRFRKFLAGSRFWKVLDGYRSFWKVLKGFGSLWKVLEGLGRFWKALDGSGRFLTVLDGCGRFWEVGECHM